MNEANNGISKKSIEDIINEHGFSETAFHLLPELIGGEWNFLEKRGDLYYSKLACNITRPITLLELSWLKSLLNDPRIKLFISDDKLKKLFASLNEVVPLFDSDEFVCIDHHLDGDSYNDYAYISNFREILKACKNNCPIVIEYNSDKTGISRRTYHPFKLCYSEFNDKFRLLCAVFNKKSQQLNKITLNLGKIVSATPSDSIYRVSYEELCALFSAPNNNPPIILEIYKERNALERFLLQFASFDRKTEYDSQRDIYTCQITYDPSDETELLIRVLGFGPTVKVLSPQNFLDQIKVRLTKQMLLMRDTFPQHLL